MQTPPIKKGCMWVYEGDVVRFLTDVDDGERIHFNDMLINGKTPLPDSLPEWFSVAFGSNEWLPGLVVHSYLN